MGGSSGTQTSTQKSEPWDGQKPYIQEGYKEAQDLYNKGPAQYFQGSTVAGFSPETQNALSAITQQGMGGQQQRAGSQYALDQFSGGNLGDWGTVGQLQQLGANNNYANNPVASRLGDMSFNGSGLGQAASGRIGDLAQNGGNIGAYTQNQLGGIASNGGNVGGYSQGAVGDITQTGGGSNSQIRNDTYDLITGAAQNANPAFSQLQATANGNYLGGNPFLDQMYGKAAQGLTRQFAEGVSPGLDSAASRAGRYGSGMHANVKDAAGQSFGQTLGDLATSIYGGNYGQERQNQLSAANSLGSQYLQGQGLRASTAGQSADQASRDAQLRLAATGQISGDLSGDLARRMQATGQIAGDMSGDASRRLSASGQLTGAEGQDAANKLAANSQLSQAYESGADRQLNSLNSASNANIANRGQQLQALGMQPAYQNMNYTDLNAASAAGAQRDQLAQQQLNDQIARWDFGQNADWQNLSRYLASIQGGSPGASVTTTQNASGLGSLGSLFAGLGGVGQLAMGTRGLLW